MSTLAGDELRNLLLHRLPEDRARALEERLVLEEDAAERLQDATYDLLDDYARERLTADERTLVERYLLGSEENRRQLAVARGLARLATAPTPAALRRAARPRVWLWPAGALIAACAALVAVLVTRPPRHVGQLGPAEIKQPPRTPIPTLSLLANAARGDSALTVRIPAGASEMRVQAEVTLPAARDYRLAVLDEPGHTLFSASHLVPRTAGAYTYIEVAVPVRALAPGARRILVEPQGGATEPTGLSWELRGLLEP